MHVKTVCLTAQEIKCPQDAIKHHAVSSLEYHSPTKVLSMMISCNVMHCLFTIPVRTYDAASATSVRITRQQQAAPAAGTSSWIGQKIVDALAQNRYVRVSEAESVEKIGAVRRLSKLDNNLDYFCSQDELINMLHSAMAAAQ
jgi:hypothetical protein